MVTEIHGILIGLLIGCVVLAIILPFFSRRELLAHITSLQSDLVSVKQSMDTLRSLINAHHELIVNNSTDNNLR